MDGYAIKSRDNLFSADLRSIYQWTVQEPGEEPRKIFHVGPQLSTEVTISFCLIPGVDVRLRAVNEGTRLIESLSVTLHISPDAIPSPETDFRFSDITGGFPRTSPENGLNPGKGLPQATSNDSHQITPPSQSLTFGVGLNETISCTDHRFLHRHFYMCWLYV